jgi:signal transduction histidine kinase
MPDTQDPVAKNTVQALWKITKVVLDTLDFSEVTQKICDSLLDELGYLNLGYRIIVLSLYDPEKNGLQRISLSQTPEAEAAVSASTIPFHDILIPLSATENICVKAYLDQKPYTSTNWQDILSPPLTPEAARTNQTAAGIKTSMVYPVIVKGKSVGTVILSMVKDYSEVSATEIDLIRGFTEIVGISVQNAKLYSDLEKTKNSLDAANEQLKLLDKVKDEFISVTSHELRAPMTAIKSYTWLVTNDKAGPLEPKAREYLNKVYLSTERLIHLVNEMLDVSRIESGRIQLHPEDFTMEKLAEDVKDEFTAKIAEQNLSLELQFPQELPTVNADREKMHQVLENLVSNAIKFTPPGGKITLTSRVNGNFLETSVIDTGNGIAPEDQQKLFIKFGRLENSLIARTGTGSGLGLFICKQYVELHRGKVWFTSTLGQGSDFTFSLPLS